MVEKPIEVIKEVEKIVQVQDTQALNLISDDNKKLKKRLVELERLVNKQPEVVEKIVEIEKVVEVPVEVERAATGDLREAARLLAFSEFNKEDLTTDQIFEMLQKSSADEVKKKLGFWAVPLPKSEKTDTPNKRYIGKKK